MTKVEYIAFKLLEWSRTCDDIPSFEKLPNSILRNAKAEAESILKRLNELE